MNIKHVLQGSRLVFHQANIFFLRITTKRRSFLLNTIDNQSKINPSASSNRHRYILSCRGRIRDLKMKCAAAVRDETVSVLFEANVRSRNINKM